MIDTRSRATLSRALAGAVVSTAAMILVTGCSSHHEPATPPVSTTAAAATPAGVDDRYPDQVLTWVAQQVFSWHPAEDPSAAAGFDRAKPLLDPTYVHQVGSTAAGLAEITGATWDRWASERATITATACVTGDDHPPDTATTHQRVVAISQHIATDSTTAAEPGRTVVAYMITSRTPGSDQWRVSMISTRSAQKGETPCRTTR